jgi:hypothetical protein
VIGGVGGAVAALVALFCLAVALMPAGALAATGAISGTVTAADTHEPLEGVEVCAWTVEEEFSGCDFSTSSDGSYVIAGLDPGEYKVEFWPEGLPYEPEFYEGTQSWSKAKPVVVESGKTTSGIDAELAPVAGLEGTVTRSSDGEPVEEVEVCAWPVSEEGFGGCTATAGDGSYLIAGLEPGEYKVEFWPGFTGQNLAYQFYKDKDRWLEADTVTVEAEETTPGIDAELHPGATIKGTVRTAATGVPLKEIHVCSIDAPTGQPWICTWTEPNGTYELPFHSKGQYKVVFSVNLAEWFGEEEFIAEEEDGFPNQFWNNQTTLAAANVIQLATGQAVSGIDARLGPPPTPPVVTPPVAPKTTVHHKPKHCRKGLKRKKVKGKVRCVKPHKHHHRRHHRVLTRAPREQRPLFRAVR